MLLSEILCSCYIEAFGRNPDVVRKKKKKMHSS